MNKKGTFTWAVKQMEEGRKVRLHFWIKDDYIELNAVHSSYEINRVSTITYNPGMSDVTATDWEIYVEPKKTLSDTIDRYYGSVKVPDLKEALKEFLSEDTLSYASMMIIMSELSELNEEKNPIAIMNMLRLMLHTKAKEIFGVELK